MRSDTRERNRFIDRSIEATAEMLEDPLVISLLGDTSRYLQPLDDVVYADIDDGVADIPQDRVEDTNSLVVVALRDGEAISMASTLSHQTDAQRLATLERFVKWGATTAEAEELYEQALPQIERPLPLHIHTQTRAMTSKAVHMVDLAELDTRVPLRTAPNAGYLQVDMRPVMVIRMRTGSRQEEPCIVGHELAHVRQYSLRPVSVIRSQRSIDMRDLRDELEAYHVGAVVAQIDRGPDLFAGSAGQIADMAQLQCIVNGMRIAHGADALDPYQPSPALLNRLDDIGLNVVLHQRLNFDALVRWKNGEGSGDCLVGDIATQG